MSADDPVVLFERATSRAAVVMAGVSAGQLDGPTPCAKWDVQQLIDHIVGGTDYPLTALAGDPPPERAGARSRTTAEASSSCRPGSALGVVWSGRACRHSASNGRSPTRWPGRSWMR